MWNNNQKVKADFRRSSLYSPPEGWFHQHFNTGAEPVRLLAFRELRGIGATYQYRLDTRQGGDMIEWEAEDPDVRSEFEAELRKKGIKSTLSPLNSP